MHSKQNDVSEHGKRSGEEGSSYNGEYGEALPEMGAFFKLRVHKSVGICKVGYMKSQAVSLIF